jgi:hypothetical protein
MRFDPGLKKLLVQRGRDVTALLAALAAGKTVDLSTLDLPDAGEGDVARLLRMQERIEKAVKCFGTGWYGHCQVCDGALTGEALAAAPWLDRCESHAR